MIRHIYYLKSFVAFIFCQTDLYQQLNLNDKLKDDFSSLIKLFIFTFLTSYFLFKKFIFIDY